jgi:hypothetical protein
MATRRNRLAERRLVRVNIELILGFGLNQPHQGKNKKAGLQ